MPAAAAERLASLLRHIETIAPTFVDYPCGQDYRIRAMLKDLAITRYSIHAMSEDVLVIRI